MLFLGCALRSLSAWRSTSGGQGKTFPRPFVAVLNPLCSTLEVFDCILLYQRRKVSVLQVRGFQQKAGDIYPTEMPTKTWTVM